jgi:peptidoglycan/LPS O-acetylase OafA/YrhL
MPASRPPNFLHLIEMSRYAEAKAELRRANLALNPGRTRWRAVRDHFRALPIPAGTQHERKSAPERIRELDVFRGVAALSVVLHHYTLGYERALGYPTELFVAFPFGRYGLELLFMISGFVIFMTLERTRRAMDFAVWRFARLYPAYWAAVALTFTIVTVAGVPGWDVNVVDALVNLTMLQQFSDRVSFPVPHVDGAYWTLHIELVFYTLMVVLYKTRLLRHIDVIAVCWLALMVVSAKSEQLLGVHMPRGANLLFLRNHAHLFIAGMMYYKVWREGHSVRRLAIIAACVVANAAVHPLTSTPAATSTPAILTLVGLFYLAVRGHLSWIVCRPLEFLGTISYSLYLLHQMIGIAIIYSLLAHGVDPHLAITTALAVVLALAVAVTFGIEEPAQRAIRAWYARVRDRRSSQRDSHLVGPFGRQHHPAVEA